MLWPAGTKNVILLDEKHGLDPVTGEAIAKLVSSDTAKFSCSQSPLGCKWTQAEANHVSNQSPEPLHCESISACVRALRYDAWREQSTTTTQRLTVPVNNRLTADHGDGSGTVYQLPCNSSRVGVGSRDTLQAGASLQS